MADLQRRDLLLRRMAWAFAALVLAVTSLSAFLRLAKDGLGCEPWPQCYAQASSGPDGTRTTATTVARVAHRLVASVTLVVALLMSMTTLAARPVRWRAAATPLAMVALVVFLAVLGRWSGGTPGPSVTLGNLLGGFVLVALAWRFALRVGTGERAVALAWAAWGVAILLVQIASGGMLSAGHAAADCPHLLACDASGAWLHHVHRAGAVLCALVLLPLGAAAWRRGRRAGAAIVLGIVAQLALGATLVLTGLPLALALAHNIVAVLLLAVVLQLAGGSAHLR